MAAVVSGVITLYVGNDVLVTRLRVRHDLHSLVFPTERTAIKALCDPSVRLFLAVL